MIGAGDQHRWLASDRRIGPLRSCFKALWLIDRERPAPLIGQTQRLAQRLEQVRVGAPAPDRTAIDWLANLPGAGGLNRPLRLLEGKARVLPVKTAMRDDVAGLPLKVVDNILILDLEHDARRQDVAPVRH